jgi:hypothetical protein
MKNRTTTQALFLLLVLLCLFACGPDLDPPVKQAYQDLPQRIDFQAQVRPILSDRCYHCHGPDEQAREADLRLDTEEGITQTLLGSGRYPLVPHQPEESEIIRRIFHKDPEELMPPPQSNLNLSAKEKAILFKWIEQGGDWQPHWAFGPPKKPLPPEAGGKWTENPIDRFVYQKLQEKGLEPSPEAPREVLVRRLSFDLTGLPPTEAQIDHFLQDGTAPAYEKLVDQLLASPAYGERWTWDWLDAARYADTNGFQGDPERKMWPWRDWVIKALNANMPFDQFVLEQLAGDLLPQATQDQILATAFNRNHMYNGEGGRIPEETRVENVFDRVETVGTVFMGLTLNCSRCHDHKFDPITQKEYYQLFAYFNQTSESGGPSGGAAPPILDLSPPDNQQKVEKIQRWVDSMGQVVAATERRVFPRPEGKTAAQSPKVRGLVGENVDALKQKPQDRNGYYLRLLYEAFAPVEPEYAAQLQALQDLVKQRNRAAGQNLRVMVMDQLDTLRPTFVLTRGIYDRPTAEVQMGLPKVLPAFEGNMPRNRLHLAYWLVSEKHPLLARVTVNRYWQAFFGRGLVRTPEDFGLQGAKPTHPELLDWLAVRFMESGWDVKALHKLIVMSATYRQSSKVSPELLALDPENQLLARGARFRLPSWMIRDQALAVSGLLVNKQGGPPVFPYQPEGIWAEATFGKKRYQQDHGAKLYRRTLYNFWRRIVGPTMLFDNANRQVCDVGVHRTNSPMHALTTLNDITYIEAARVMAERLLNEGASAEERLERGFRWATARSPNETEKQILTKRLTNLKKEYKLDPEAARELLAIGEKPVDEQLDPVVLAAYTGLCSLILNLDETITKP